MHSKSLPVEKCEEGGTFDYFYGSEVSFILTYSAITLIIIGLTKINLNKFICMYCTNTQYIIEIGFRHSFPCTFDRLVWASQKTQGVAKTTNPSANFIQDARDKNCPYTWLVHNQYL